MTERRLGFKLGFVGLCAVMRSLWLHFETDVEVAFYAKHLTEYLKFESKRFFCEFGVIALRKL